MIIAKSPEEKDLCRLQMVARVAGDRAFAALKELEWEVETELTKELARGLNRVRVQAAEEYCRLEIEIEVLREKEDTARRIAEAQAAIAAWDMR